MKQHYRLTLTSLLSATLITSLAGCDWSSGGGADGFNSSRITSSVAGVYRSPSSGTPLVTNFEVEGSGGVEVVKGEQIGTGDGSKTTFSGTLSRETIIPGTVKVFGSGFTFSDDGAGRLVGSPSGTGSITYDNGAISVDFGGVAPDNGDEVMVDYSYDLQFNANVGSGASATTIYSFNVQQTGDSIRFVDNNGDAYSGKLGGSQISGNPATDVNLTERLQFEVNGTSRGIAVKIAGVFTVKLTVEESGSGTVTLTTSGNDQGGTQSTEERDIKTYATTDLQMDGTWIEPRAQGNVRGIVY